MSFYNYNIPWIKCLRSNKELIIGRNSIQKMKEFLGFQGAYFPTLPLPLIIEKESYIELCNAGSLLLQAQTKILRFLLSECSREEILEMFNLPYSIMPFIDWHELGEDGKLFGRFDIIPSSNGYQFCEINADPAVNGLKLFDAFYGYSSSLGWTFMNNHVSPRRDVANYLHKLVLKHKFEYVIIFSLEDYINEGSGTVKSLFNIVKEAIPEAQILLVDENSYPRDLLNPIDGKKTLIYRMAIYQDIKFHELLLEIFNSGATIINTFETEIRSNKKWFAIFHDPKYQKLLTPNEQFIILKFVPPTFELSPTNFENFLNDKTNYVFRKNISYGGLGILMGTDHETEFLRNTISDLNSWTAQEIIGAEDILLPEDKTFLERKHKIVLGLFFVNNKYSGMLVRASSISNVVNVTYGGAKMGWAYPILESERQHCMKEVSK